MTYTPLSPFDVFDADTITAVHDTGDCWLWTGQYKVSRDGSRHPYYSYTENKHTKLKSMRAIVMERMGNEPRNAQSYVPICEQDLCVHPDHIDDRYSDAGRLLFVKNQSEQQGECRIWTGSGSSGYLRIPTSRTKSDFISAHKFVYMQEHGLPYFMGGTLRLSCDNRMCVSHKHISFDFRPANGLCPEAGHKLPPGASVCPICARPRSKGCDRGHVLPAHEASYAGNIGCWHCRSEDALEFMRERNEASMKAGRL